MYLSADKVDSEAENELRYPVKMFKNLTAGSVFPAHRLRLKKGISVMLLGNLDSLNGHVNGGRHLIENMTNNIIFLRLAGGSTICARLKIQRIRYSPGDDSFLEAGFTKT